MTDWEPATEVEAAMRDALRAGDQELYFRILARSELLLPVSSDALAGRAQVGWGTWTTNGRTHVLAFTSGDALRICLADNAGSARRMPYHDLAATWPNLEWWLAVNPGLPIEGYLPAWFVAQLARGDVKLPGRTMGARARLDRAESAARARARASVPGQVVQGEIIEPPFVDRAAAATGPVLEPDSIEPPQRNRPARPPGFDSPIASMRRRGGLPPADATPSSPAAPPPFRPTPQVTDVTPAPYQAPIPPPQVTDVTPAAYRAPIPPPQVTDVTPAAYRAPIPPPQVSDATPRPQRAGQQPAAFGESPWPPPVVHGDQTPRPLRQPPDPPREVTDRPAPTMRPRSPLREDPARSSPPARFGAPPPAPRPTARPTSGGGFFGAPDQQPEPGLPARGEPRQTTWSPANGAAAGLPTETRPSAGMPNGAAASAPWPSPGRDAPGWSDSTPPAHPAPAWPGGTAPAPPPDAPQASVHPLPTRQSGSATPVGSEQPGTKAPWPDRPAGSSPMPSGDRGPAVRTPGQSWPQVPVAGAPQPTDSPGTQPWPDQRPAAAPSGPTAQPRADQAHIRASGSAPAQRWTDHGPDAPAAGAPAVSPSESATPQTWAHTTPLSEVPADTAASDRAARPSADQLPAESAPRATDLWADQKRPDAATAAEPAARATDLWSGRVDGPAGGAVRSGSGEPKATDLWPGQQQSVGAADGAVQSGSDKPQATDLWSGQESSTGPADAGSEKARATDLWPRQQPSAGPTDERAVRPSSAKPRATDLWSGQQPGGGSADSAAPTGSGGAGRSDQRPGGSPADGAVQAGSADARASDLRSGQRPGGGPADGAVQAGSADARVADLWSGQKAPGAADDAALLGSGGARASEPQSGQQPGGGPADDAARAVPGDPRASELRSGQQPGGGAADGAALAGSGEARAADLWPGQRNADGAAQGSGEARATDLWSGESSPAGAVEDRAKAGPGEARATDLWSDPKRAEAAPAAESAGRATDLWPDQQSPAGAGKADERAEAAAADLWRDQTPLAEQGGAEGAQASGSASRLADLWSTPQGTLDEQAGAANRWPDQTAGPGKPDEQAAWPAQQPSDGQAGAVGLGSRVEDMWSDQRAGAAEADEQASAAESRALDPRPDQSAPEQAGAVLSGSTAANLWPDQSAGPANSEEQAGDGAQSGPRSDQQAGGPDGSATDLWSGRQPADDRAAAGKPESRATDLWSRGTAADGQATAAPAAEAPERSSTTDLWGVGAEAGSGLEQRQPTETPRAGEPPAADAAESWLDRATAGTAENPVTTPAQSWSGRASAAPAPGVERQWTEPVAPAKENAAWADRTPTTGTVAPSWLEKPTAPQEASVFTGGTGPVPADFQPANDVEESLLNAAGAGSTDTFLSTLLLARVLLPVSVESRTDAQPGSDGFVWRTETIDDEPYVVVFTSPERMAEHLDKGPETVTVKFVRLINSWPQENWSFAVNPGTPVGAKLPGAQIVALASWAAEVGLDGGEDEPVVAAAPKQEAPAPAPTPAAVDATSPTMMQKTIAPSQVDYYLERGYDRVSGFVHRVTEVSHLRTPAQLFTALGLGYANSPFTGDATEVYVLRWPAYRPSLYRIPYGGQNQTAMRAMEGWVIERAPFRGNGFAPGEGSDVIAEFKVDSARLPHGAQLWLVRADGSEHVVATLDADAPGWIRAGEL